MSDFSDRILAQKRPSSVRGVKLPRETYTPSPADWRNEVLYFLLPDRFSNGKETDATLLDRSNICSARPANFMWCDWAKSGGERWQGGTISGITSKLDYLIGLGITTLWVGPVFKQRKHLNCYHGYGIQDFLDVDPRFGSRKDLVDLIGAAHKKELRIILDIIFNHSGHNWDYQGNEVDPPYKPYPDYYQKGNWVDARGGSTPNLTGDEDGVWPQELQPDDCYTRAGKGSLCGEKVEDDHVEMKRTDFEGSFRDFNFDGSDTLNDLARCYKYWIALTDCDGFRLDTLKHVPEGAARNFCGSIKEFAAAIGKTNFFLVGEVGGPDDNAGKYLDALELNLNATLDIGDSRVFLTAVAKGLMPAYNYFGVNGAWDPQLGSHRYSGPRHVIVLNDHDHVCGEKIRFSWKASSEQQVVAGTAIQLFSLGIPCIYYGTEQALAGPEESEQKQYLPDFGSNDKYLREIMFASEHPLADQKTSPGSLNLDTDLPTFGAFGTVGRHCFDSNFHVYKRIRHLIDTRQKYPILRYGRQYLRDISNFGAPFAPSPAGEIVAWSRILDEDEALCVINGNGIDMRGADIIIDNQLNAAPGSFFEVVCNPTQKVMGPRYNGAYPIGRRLQTSTKCDIRYLEIRGLQPSEVIVLCNRPSQ